MTPRFMLLVLAGMLPIPWLQCLDMCHEDPPDAGSVVTIRIINDSTDRFVSPNLGVCPNGMLSMPHHFVEPAPILGPGQEITYTSFEIACGDGNCQTFSTDFAIGLCGWGYGDCTCLLTNAATRYSGSIGVQFFCGDTVILRWTASGDEPGTWTSEVESAEGNDAPSGPFQVIP